MRLLRKKEKGSTLIEWAMIMPVLLVLALGAYEYGMVFRDSHTVSTAVREAGRVAASAADHGKADCVILEAASGALQALQTGEIDEVHIYKSDVNGSYPGPSSSYTRRYRPAVPMEPGLIQCTSGAEWYPIQLGSNWDPSDRVDDPGNADWIGVQIEYTHTFQTNFLWFSGTTQLSDDAVFRIEPPAP